MRKFSFENLHRNHKLAYLDGLLCGLVIAYYGSKIYQQIQEDREFDRKWDEALRADKQGTTK